MTTAALYLPDNPNLWSLLESLPRSLAPYRDHAMLLVHFVCHRRWTRNPDPQKTPGGYSYLNAKILRKYIPDRVLPQLKRFLVSEGVIVTMPHSSGHHATGYRISRPFDGSPKRYVITNPKLSAKVLIWRASYVKGSSSTELNSVIKSRRLILSHMRHSLSDLTLRGPYEEVVADAVGGGVDADHASYICSLIHFRDHIHIVVDEFGRRVHSIATRTSKVIRPSFQLQGKPIIEIDVQNSQPVLLSMLLGQQEQNQQSTNPTAIPHPYTHQYKPPPTMMSKNCELRQFREICEGGRIYEELMQLTNSDDRDKVKKELFRDVLFGRPNVKGPVTEAFCERWPGVFNAIVRMKHRHGYKVISRCLQRLESHIMIDQVCGQLVLEHPHIKFVTIHDCITTTRENSEIVQAIMVEAFRRRGGKCRVSITGEWTDRRTY